MNKLDASKALLERAYRVIPSASQTFSKGPNQWARGVSPHFLERAEGAWVWDADGNKYLDWLMALGPISLGYRHAATDRAIVEQLGRGAVFSQMSALEVEVAEMLIECIPCADMVRFAKTGSDVTAAAVRVSRAFTGRDRVALCGYHGWQDWFIGTTTRDLGIPMAVKELSHTFAYNDIASLENLFNRHPGEFACVVMEGVGVEEPKDGFLEKVRALTEKHGVLLVFDEIVAGFRLAIGGAHEYYGIKPDLACFGKAMANGMPLSAIVGRRDVMETFDRIFFSGTFGGECLSLAAGKATIETFKREKVTEHVWRIGGLLLNGVKNLIERHQLTEHVRILGLAPRTVVAFPHSTEAETLKRRTLVMQQCVKRGLLYFCSHLPTLSHGHAEVDFTLSALDHAFAVLSQGIKENRVGDLLEGPPVEAIFRRA